MIYLSLEICEFSSSGNLYTATVRIPVSSCYAILILFDCRPRQFRILFVTFIRIFVLIFFINYYYLSFSILYDMVVCSYMIKNSKTIRWCDVVVHSYTFSFLEPKNSWKLYKNPIIIIIFIITIEEGLKRNPFTIPHWKYFVKRWF